MLDFTKKTKELETEQIRSKEYLDNLIKKNKIDIDKDVYDNCIEELRINSVTYLTYWKKVEEVK